MSRSDGEDQGRWVWIEASVLMHRRRHTYQQIFSRILQPVATTQLARPAVYALQRKAFPGPVLLLLYTPQAPCQPIANRHAAMEPLCTLACKDQMRTLAPCKYGVRPLRPYLPVQVFNARRRMPGECSRREEPLIRQRQFHGSGACIVHSDGQRPAHRHTNACTSAANRHGCGGPCVPTEAVSVRIPETE